MSTSPESRPAGGPRAAAASAPAIDEGRRSPGGPGPAAKPAPGPGRRIALLVAVAVVASVAFIYWWNGRKFEDTDDGQVDGNISNIGTRVAGTVTAVRVVENQPVHVGDLLLEIDASDLAVEVKQARASVALAEAQLQAEDPSVSITETSNTAAVAGASSELAGANAGISAAQKDVDQQSARLVEAEGNQRLAQIERRRGEELLKGQAIPQADVDRRVTAAETAAAQVQAIKQSLAAARQRVLQLQAQLVASRSRLTEVRKNAPRQVATRRAAVLSGQANLELARAQLAQAELNASYAALRSPVDGVVAKKAVNVGDHVGPGQQLVAIAQTSGLWITANFRETQVEHMHAGQAATVRIDALGAELTGRIESMGAATGSRMSLFPPENASGNYVKVVQRIPVRIRLDPGQPGLERLRPGMSAEPKVRLAP